MQNDPLAAVQFDVFYSTLHRIAAAQMRRERTNHTLSATALLHEAYLSLARSTGLPMEPTQFSALASHVMRNVLVNYAVARATDKRGHGEPAMSLTQTVTVDMSNGESAEEAIDVQALHEALVLLGAKSERQARIVELRYFAGLSLDEVAAALDVSLATVKRDWTVARMFLRRALTDAAP